MTDLADTPAIAAELQQLVERGELDLPRPACGRTWLRWATLASLGARDLSLARLAEGHADALAILAEAGRQPARRAMYGVWAAKSGGTGADLVDDALSGTVRFCSGAHLLDRALVVAGEQLVDVELARDGIRRHPETWRALGMADSDSADVTFDDVPITETDLIGEPGWYASRPGFGYGGCGVAAVWLGGCRGVLADVRAHLRERRPDEHQLAHLGAMHSAIQAAQALLRRTADAIDARTEKNPVSSAELETCRAAVESCTTGVLERAPKITGPTPLCRDRTAARRQADLLVYVRQHHAERDLARLGHLVLADEGAP